MGLLELDFVKISALAEAVEVTEEDYIPVVQSGVTKKALIRNFTQQAIAQLGSAAFLESNSFDSKGSSEAVEVRAKQRDDAQNERINKLDLALYLLKNNKVYKAFKTQSLMISKKSEIPFDSLVTVADDPANNPAYDDLNGEYLWDGLNFYKLPNHILLQAKSYADGKAFEVMGDVEAILYNDMVPYIDNKATTAKTEAINAAATDATSKANSAEDNAKDYAYGEVLALAAAASTDATNKATSAKTEAISTAANDAALKANAAEANAKNYANSNANFKSKVLTEANHLDDLKEEGKHTALNSVVANTSRGYPSNEAGTLEVFKHGSNNTTQQEYLTITGKLFSRTFIASWSTWIQQASLPELNSAKTEILNVSLVNRGAFSDSAITSLTDMGAYSVSNMTDFPSDFPATYGIVKRFKFGSYAYWELSTTSRPDIVWQKVGVAAWRKISVDDALAPFLLKDSLSLNKDKLYPVLALTRGAVAPNLNVQALEKHILDMKVNGANPDCYYRISYYGNNSTLASEANKFGWTLQEISKSSFAESGGTVKALTSSATTKYEILPNTGIVQFTLQSTVDTIISFDFTVDTTGFDQTVLYSHAVSTSQAWGHIIDPLKYALRQAVDETVIDEKIALNNKSLEAVPSLPVLTATAAGLVPIDLLGNADFSNLLYSKSINTAISPASVTKTMSVIVALESGMPLSNLLTVIAGDIATGSGNNLLEGDQITLLDALYNMMLPSSNTSANLVARTVGTFLGGDTATFISRMNTKASALGMANTVFKNPSGLAASGHTSTVNDLLKLGVYASKNETMKSIWGQVTHTINIQGSNPRNVLIDSSVDPVVNGEPWAIGGKTGTLAPSVYNMLLFVRLRNGYTGMLVTANSTSDVDRLTDVIKIAEYSRNRFVYPAPNEITAII